MGSHPAQEARPTGAGPGSGTRLLVREGNRASEWQVPAVRERKHPWCGAPGLLDSTSRRPVNYLTVAAFGQHGADQLAQRPRQVPSPRPGRRARRPRSDRPAAPAPGDTAAAPAGRPAARAAPSGPRRHARPCPPPRGGCGHPPPIRVTSMTITPACRTRPEDYHDGLASTRQEIGAAGPRAGHGSRRRRPRRTVPRWARRVSFGPVSAHGY